MAYIYLGTLIEEQYDALYLSEFIWIWRWVVYQDSSTTNDQKMACPIGASSNVTLW